MTDRTDRARAVSDAKHSGAMEGPEVSVEFRADAELYVEGTINLDEFRRRTRTRNSLPLNDQEKHS